MFTALFVITILLAVTVTTTFLLGFRLGGNHWQSELARVRMEAARAERQLHDLTRDAFVSMTKEAERRLGRGE